MSIQAITGKTGASKTYHSMEYVLLDALRKGFYVITNIAGLKPHKIASLFGLSLADCERLIIEISLDEFTHFWELPIFYDLGFPIYSGDDFDGYTINCPKNAVIIFDEVHKKFGTQNHNAPYLAPFFAILTLSRKMGWDIWLITQCIDNLNTKISSLVQVTHFLKDAALYGLGSSRYVHGLYEQTLENVPSAKMKSYIRKRDPNFFLCYKSREDGVTDTKPGANVFVNVKTVTFAVLLLAVVAMTATNALKSKSNWERRDKGLPIADSKTSFEKPSDSLYLSSDSVSSGEIFLDGVKYFDGGQK